MKDEALVSSTFDTSQSTGSARLCRFFQRGNCRHGHSCHFLHTNKEDGSNEVTNNPNSKRKAQSEQDKARREYESELHALGLVSAGQSNRNGHKPINNTSLLNKLLQRDKEREQRLTLQLLRYIVDCDFFDGRSGSSNSKDTSTQDNDEKSSK
jgi:hypothetical protein